jgi:hypothetical protein
VRPKRSIVAGFQKICVLWHARCFMEQWQARKQLSRDPAASTSLSVACRYASRPPSDPTLSPPIREPGQMTGFSCVWAPYFQAQ